MNFKDLAIKGKTCRDVYKDGDRVYFIVSDTEKYALAHEQDCCEQVYIESVDGDLEDLIGAPLLMAEEAYRRPEEGELSEGQYDYSVTFSFYKFATINGYVTIRYTGESNGYYSEEAELYRVDNEFGYLTYI